MELHPISLVLFWVSRKNCINGLLPGLEECHSSSPLDLMWHKF
jgi:hypothetical protein